MRAKRLGKRLSESDHETNNVAVHFRSRSLIGDIQDFVKAIREGVTTPDLKSLKERIEFENSELGRRNRVAFDYVSFKRSNLFFNQIIINFAAIATFGSIPTFAFLVVYFCFQLVEVSNFWMTGAVKIQILENRFNTNFWHYFKYFSNFFQFVFSALAFFIFVQNAHFSSYVTLATCYLIVAILSSPLNFFSLKFNLFNLLWQFGLLIIYSIYQLNINGIDFQWSVHGLYLVPVVLSLFAGHAGVATYAAYYMSSLENELTSNTIQAKLIESTRVLAREKYLNDRIQSTINEAIVLVDLNCDIVQANGAFYRMFQDKLEPKRKDNFCHYISEELFITDGKKRNFETDSGRHYIIEGTSLFVEGEAGLAIYILIDVTEKYLSDQAATQAQKLNALGALSGGIAHDFNNTLAVILANAELIQQSENIEKIKSDYLADIIVSCENATGLTKQILSIARKMPLKNQALDPNVLVRDTAHLVHNTIEPFHHIKVICSSHFAVMGDQVLLKNAILNLLLNARDAMIEGGEIILRTFDEAGHVVFEVEDFGTGIDPKVIDKVVEPFFTLKENEKGTGIGLAMVKQFAERTGGYLELISELGQGTSARIKLPQVDKTLLEEIMDQSIEVEAEQLGRVMNILIVDDNVLLAKSMVRQIQLMGHKVQAAHELDEVAMIENLDQFDLVLCDVVLRSETGIDVWNYFLELELNTKFIFISGNISPNLRERLTQIGATRILEKPLAFSALKTEISNALGD